MSTRRASRKPRLQDGRRRTLGAGDQDLAEARAQQTATSQILRAISDSPTDVGPVFAAIARNSVVLCQGIQGAVFQFDGELIHVGALHGFSADGADATRRAFPRRPDRGMIAARAVLDRRVVHVPDVFKDREFTERTLAVAAGWRSLLVVPMLRGGKVLGTVASLGRRPDRSRITRSSCCGPSPSRESSRSRTCARPVSCPS